MPTKIIEEKIEAGKDILSYCGKCKADSIHIISAMEKDKLSKVMCKTCNAKHNYRKPKSLAKDNPATKPSKRAKSTPSRKNQRNPSKKWNDLVENYDLNGARDYTMKQSYEESSIIRHPAFGIGVVTKKVDQTRIEVQFELGVKLLVINRA